MDRLAFFIVAFVVGIVTAVVADAHMAGTDDFQITHPWAQPASGDTTRAFPTIANDGDKPRAVTAVSTPVAGAVSIILKGEPVERLTVPAGEIYGPDQLQFRLDRLTKPLHKGDHFPVTLTLDDGSTIEFHMVVGEDTAMPEMDMKDIPAMGKDGMSGKMKKH